MSLSIIIISLNEEKYLPRLLSSISKQDFKGSYEIILSDNHSTDRTREIARQHRVKVVEGGLPSIGRNRGAQAAKGDVYLFLDADMVLPKSFLRENLAEFIRRNLDMGICTHTPDLKSIVQISRVWMYNSLMRACQYFSPHGGGCLLCKRQLFEKSKGYNEEVLFQEDSDFVSRCSKLGKVRVLTSVPAVVSMRRIEREGMLRFSINAIYLEFYKLFRGNIKRMPINYEMQGMNLKDVKK